MKVQLTPAQRKEIRMRKELEKENTIKRCPELFTYIMTTTGSNIMLHLSLFNQMFLNGASKVWYKPVRFFNSVFSLANALYRNFTFSINPYYFNPLTLEHFNAKDCMEMIDLTHYLIQPYKEERKAYEEQAKSIRLQQRERERECRERQRIKEEQQEALNGSMVCEERSSYIEQVLTYRRQCGTRRLKK